jgi:CHASE3 domain sensor protein
VVERRARALLAQLREQEDNTVPEAVDEQDTAARPNSYSATAKGVVFAQQVPQKK